MAKYVSSKILQIKTNPDDTTGNILKYKASINSFKYYYLFRYPSAKCVLQFFHI